MTVLFRINWLVLYNWGREEIEFKLTGWYSHIQRHLRIPINLRLCIVRQSWRYMKSKRKITQLILLPVWDCNIFLRDNMQSFSSFSLISGTKLISYIYFTSSTRSEQLWTVIDPELWAMFAQDMPASLHR